MYVILPPPPKKLMRVYYNFVHFFSYFYFSYIVLSENINTPC